MTAMLAALLLLIGAACAAAQETPPNIVLVISDDHGYRDYGFMGSPIVRTPNLDRLAAEGVVFRRGFTSSSVCQPSHLTLLTGLHPEQVRAQMVRLGHSRWRGNTWAATRLATLPRLLGGRGYVSFQGGKYWGRDYRPAGFTHGTTVSGLSSGERVLTRASGGTGLALGRETMQPLWDFLDGEGRRRPFFVWFAPMLPHTPFDAPPQYHAPYQHAALVPGARAYYANITRLDDRVGELLRYLERTGQRRRTLIVFVADNGWHQPPDVAVPLFGGGDRGKGSIYEHGYRTPIIFSWPGHIPQGEVRDELVATVDLFPTLLDFAGVPTPAGRDGISLYPTLTESRPFTRRHVVGGERALRAEKPTLRVPTVNERAYFVRDATWRYVWYMDRRSEELYRVEEDPDEQRNVAAEHPTVVASLRARLKEWIARMRRLHPE